MRTQRKRHPVRMSVAAGVLAVPLALGACGDDGNDVASTPPAATQAGPDVGDITDDYFTDPSYVGRTVTVQGTVTRVVGPSSFLLDGKEYGDDTLLVISAPAMNVEAGQQVDVTGVVRQFDYEIYRDGFGLADPGLYGDFEQEEVLVVGVRRLPAVRPRRFGRRRRRVDRQERRSPVGPARGFSRDGRAAGQLSLTMTA